MPKINHYFDEKVTSIAFQTANKPATVGVMEVGEYEFATSEFETMTVVCGEMEVKLPNTNIYQTYSANQSFSVAANELFAVRVTVETAYLCLYGE